MYVEHAERNAIYDAAARGIATTGKTMICPWFACENCARGIIQAKIKLVIGHETPMEQTPEHWRASIKIALQMLEEAGVQFYWYSGKIDESNSLSIRFNEQSVYP